MSFVEKATARSAASAGHNIDAITNAMVSAALQADVGGGQTAAIYRSYHQDIVRPAYPLLSKQQLAQIPADIAQDLQTQGNSRVYNGLGDASSRFQSELYQLALLIYIEATNPNADIDRALRMQKNSLENAVESWQYYANLDNVFKGEHHGYSGSPQLLPTMLKAVEGAMRQSLKDQKIGKEIRVELY